MGKATDGEAVDRMLLDDLFGDMMPGAGNDGPDGFGEMMTSALDAIERHLAPLTQRQVAGLLRLELLDDGRGDLKALVQRTLELRLLRGSHEPFLRALETGSLIKHFKGYSGRVVGGGLGGGRR